MRRRHAAPIAAGVAALLALAAAPAAQATFHLMQVREIYAGTALKPESEYVELQMYASGQNHVGGHVLRAYNESGTVVGASIFPADVANGANQSTILLATPQAEAEFGFTGDKSLSPPGEILAAGGAVCWEEIDCVSWGDFSGKLPSPAGTNVAPLGIPDGMALRRTIARGCPTALDPQDDSNDSAADFSPAAPQPRPNSLAPSEQLCGTPGSGGGGGGPAQQPGRGAPETFLRKKPAKRGSDRTPTFRFGADEAGVRFECKLDGKPFRACRSPFTTKALSFGPHRFQVRARDSDGKLDPTPASYRFRIVRRG
jgi:hypothetical protein